MQPGEQRAGDLQVEKPGKNDLGHRCPKLGQSISAPTKFTMSWEFKAARTAVEQKIAAPSQMAAFSMPMNRRNPITAVTVKTKSSGCQVWIQLRSVAPQSKSPGSCAGAWLDDA